MKYRLTYVCPLCGCNCVYESQETDQETCLQWLAKRMRLNDLNADRFNDYPMYVPHKCTDGSVGIARLSGFKKVVE